MICRLFHCSSADVYEFSTETLFFGRQDAMQRISLVPLHDHIQRNNLNPGTMRLLEVSAGTGRFHTFLKVCCNLLAVLPGDQGCSPLPALLCFILAVDVIPQPPTVYNCHM